jgi:hypothetical protein
MRVARVETLLAQQRKTNTKNKTKNSSLFQSFCSIVYCWAKVSTEHDGDYKIKHSGEVVFHKQSAFTSGSHLELWKELGKHFLTSVL